jgi:hypothetical protein
MKSTKTKFATAAVIIIAVIIILNQLGTPIDGANKAFAKVLENTNKMPWLHIVTRDLLSSSPKEPSEMWFNFSAKIQAYTFGKTPGSYIDFANKIRYIYYSDRNELWIITRDKSLEDSWISKIENNSEYLEVSYNISTDYENRNIEKDSGQRQGKNVDIYTLTTKETKSKKNYKREIYVDQETNLITFEFFKIVDLSGNLLRDQMSTYSYPDEGPKDIYELGDGIPETARIVDYTANNTYRR